MIPDKFWFAMRKVQRIHRLMYVVGLGPLIGRIILLLTTTGRKTGLKRVTPLQYEQVDGMFLIGSARGTHSDWFKNIQADHNVEVRVRNLRIHGTAEPVTDIRRIADFLELRLKRHPRMVGLMMEKAHGLPRRPTREQLEELAASEAMVIVTPNPVQT